MFNAERVEVGWGGGAEEKSGERAGGLRWDKEGVSPQRDLLREEGRARDIQPNEKSRRERQRGELWEDGERKKRRETETRRKTERWRGSTVAE